MEDLKPKVSVVIPTYNRQKYLAELLSSLDKQTYKNFEVIIVDDGSTDGSVLDYGSTKYFMHKISASPNYLCLMQDNKGAAAARNNGVAMANGEIIAFIDDDCIADDNWLEKGVKHFDDKDVVAVTGQIEKEDKETTPTSCVTYTFNANGFMTANVFYRKTAFKNVGGFDLRFKSFREDSDLGIRIAKTGKVVNEPKSRVIHRIIDYSVFGFFKKHIKLKETYYDVLFYKKHPEEFKELGEFFVWPITTHMLWPYAFLFFCSILTLAWLFKTQFASFLIGSIFGTGYFWTVFFHTKMRSNIKTTQLSKHPIKWLGLLSIWWMALTWDILQRLKAIIVFRKMLM